MILYHGSNIEIREPKLLQSKRFLDFGYGFYLTSDLDQAKKWANHTTELRGEGFAVVSCFEIDDDELSNLKTLTFPKANKTWLKYVAANRKGLPVKGSYDLVIGPVANDQTFRVVSQFVRGLFSINVAIMMLMPQKLKDQYAFKTEKAIRMLNFMEVISV